MRINWSLFASSIFLTVFLLISFLILSNDNTIKNASIKNNIKVSDVSYIALVEDVKGNSVIVAYNKEGNVIDAAKLDGKYNHMENIRNEFILLSDEFDSTARIDLVNDKENILTSYKIKIIDLKLTLYGYMTKPPSDFSDLSFYSNFPNSINMYLKNELSDYNVINYIKLN